MKFKRFLLNLMLVLLLTSHFGVFTVSCQEAPMVDVTVQSEENQQTSQKGTDDNAKKTAKTSPDLSAILDSLDKKVPESGKAPESVLNEEEQKEVIEYKKEAENRGFFDTLKYKFYKTFIEQNRWMEFLKGLGNTVLIAIGATMIGVIIGLIIAVTKVSNDMVENPGILLRFFNFIFSIYTTVIRGTPTLVQIIIFYFIIMSKSENYILSAMLTFGINSGAYVSEIVRGGINSIDKGQFEAGRSLGLSHTTTMTFIIIPQAIKNILPSIGNEFIILLKDTSLASYIGAHELMKAAETVSGRTYDVLFPYISVALIYLVMVICLEQLFKYMERRMAKSDRH